MKVLKRVQVNTEMFDVCVYTMENDNTKLVELRSAELFAHAEDGIVPASNEDTGAFHKYIELGNSLKLEDDELDSWVDEQVLKLNDPTDVSSYF